jgi:hypothetical protein
MPLLKGPTHVPERWLTCLHISIRSIIFILRQRCCSVGFECSRYSGSQLERIPELRETEDVLSTLRVVEDLPSTDLVT